MLPRIPRSPSLSSFSVGPPCGSIGLSGENIGHQNRLPLHLWYRFDKPGAYEVKYTDWRAMATTPGAPPQTETAWTRVEIQPAQPWKPGPPPQDAAEAISDYLPSILGFPGPASSEDTAALSELQPFQLYAVTADLCEVVLGLLHQPALLGAAEHLGRSHGHFRGYAALLVAGALQTGRDATPRRAADGGRLLSS
jgi:hypothetical protein